MGGRMYVTTSVVVVVLAGQALTAGPYFGVCTAVLALFLISTLWFNDADQGLTTVVGLLLTWQALIGPSIVLATALFGAYLAVNFCIADADQSTLAASRRRPADAFKGKTVWCVPRACIGRPPTGAASIRPRRPVAPARSRQRSYLRQDHRRQLGNRFSAGA
jgi:hypothetical protein